MAAATSVACSGGHPQPVLSDAGSTYAISAENLPDGRQGVPYLGRVTAIGQVPADLSWSIVAGSLPLDLGLSPTGADTVAISACQHEAVFSHSRSPPTRQMAGARSRISRSRFARLRASRATSPTATKESLMPRHSI